MKELFLCVGELQREFRQWSELGLMPWRAYTPPAPLVSHKCGARVVPVPVPTIWYRQKAW